MGMLPAEGQPVVEGRRFARRSPRVLGLHLLATCMWFAALAVPSVAFAHDGAIHWRTLRSDVAEVHHPAALEPFARRVLHVFGDAYRTLTPLFDYRPPLPVQIVVDDYADDSNGFATAFPYDRLLIRPYPPAPTDDLADSGDWLRALVFHEYSHVLHLAATGGLPSVINTVLGRTWLPNNFLPRFFVEGLATHMETRHVGGDRAVAGRGGRVERARYMGRLRAAIRDKTFPSASELIGRPLRWPRSSGWYLYGSWLLDYQARRYGHSSLRRFVRSYGRRLVPYGINNLYRQIYGKDAIALWRGAVEELRGRVSAEDLLRAAGRVPPVSGIAVLASARTALTATARWRSPGEGSRLTRNGEWRGRLRLHPNGQHAFYARAPADGLARIERINVRSGRVNVIRRCELDCNEVVITPDGRWLLWIATRPHRRLYRRRDVFAAPLDAQGRAGSPLRLTRGLRAREPSVSADGRRLWVITVDRGLTAIRSLPLATALACARAGRKPPSARLVVQGNDIAQTLSSPVEGPGPRLWFARGGRGQRQLWSVPLGEDGGPAAAAVAQPLLPAAGLAAGPESGSTRVAWLDELQIFRRDGRTWLGALVELGSYRDVAELPLGATGTVDSANASWRLRSWTGTGVYSAAFAPAGQVAMALIAHGNGLEVHRLAASQTMPEPAARPLKVATAGGLYRPAKVPARLDAYSPLWTSRPRAWMPSLELQATGLEVSPDQIIAGATVEGTDAVRLYRWQLFTRTDLAFERPSVILSADLKRWEPRWTLVGAWVDGTSHARRGFRVLRLANRRFSLRLGGAWALPLARDNLSFETSLRLAHTHFRDDLALWRKRQGLPEPFGPEPNEPFEGAALNASVGVVWDRSERYPNSSVIERRRRISFFTTVADHWTLADRRLLRFDLRGDLSWPMGGHRVLQWRSRLGWAPLHVAGTPAFRLEGLPPFDAEELLFGPAGGDFGTVRGVVDPDVSGLLVAGGGLLWSSVSAHLPLVGVGRGLDILPLFFGRLWLTLFGDAAVLLADDDADLRDAISGPGAAASAGGELRVQLETGYVAQGTLRLGYARAFGDIGSSQWYIRLGN